MRRPYALLANLVACGSFGQAPGTLTEAGAAFDNDGGVSDGSLVSDGAADVRVLDDGAAGFCPTNAQVCEDFEGNPGISNRVTTEGGAATVASDSPLRGLQHFRAAAGRGDSGPNVYGGLLASFGGAPKRIRSRFAVRFTQLGGGPVDPVFAISDPRLGYRVVLRAHPSGSRAIVEVYGVNADPTVPGNGAQPSVFVGSVPRDRWHSVDWSTYEDGHADVSINGLPEVHYPAPSIAYGASSRTSSYIGCFGTSSSPWSWVFDFDDWSLANE
jgi:hypothetical protein